MADPVVEASPVVESLLVAVGLSDSLLLLPSLDELADGLSLLLFEDVVGCVGLLVAEGLFSDEDCSAGGLLVVAGGDGLAVVGSGCWLVGSGGLLSAVVVGSGTCVVAGGCCDSLCFGGGSAEGSWAPPEGSEPPPTSCGHTRTTI